MFNKAGLKEMELDLVHDIQRAYRKVLDSMSRPGKIISIGDQADKISLEAGCLPATLLLVLMLFDTEIKFNVCSPQKAEMAKLINQLTYAKASEENKADFILILNDAHKDEAERALKLANKGDLLNPHKSATVIVEAEAIGRGSIFTLTGPGIAKERQIKINTLENLFEIRNEKNAEYPLGIDLIMTDSENDVVSIPRTTQVRKQVHV